MSRSKSINQSFQRKRGSKLMENAGNNNARGCCIYFAVVRSWTSSASEFPIKIDTTTGNNGFSHHEKYRRIYIKITDIISWKKNKKQLCTFFTLLFLNVVLYTIDAYHSDWINRDETKTVTKFLINLHHHSHQLCEELHICVCTVLINLPEDYPKYLALDAAMTS